MNEGYKKYRPFRQVALKDRRWPQNAIEKAPVWCSVDLRDGNQALVNPMDLGEKLLMFNTLVEMGFKEIEVGFPSASQTEYDILRTLIEGGHIPDDVTIQVLVQAREHLIRKTFEAIDGAKKAIVHFYNSTSSLQREVVFGMDKEGVTDIALGAARLIKTLAEEKRKTGASVTIEYTPESFSGTEEDFAVEICDRVLTELGAGEENRVIVNLPSTVELCTPNTYADQVEYFIRNLPRRERAIVSIHPHNDRGTGVASAELALLAGAERVEGTLFGNGERTGNVDIVTLALNIYSQGIDPGLRLDNLKQVQEIYEQTTGMRIHERHPYVGELVFTAFSGSHQDAISKGEQYMKNHGAPFWSVPYLPIDPADIGRSYEPVVRINSQSGKGGAAYIMHSVFGYDLPKAMHGDFGRAVKAACDRLGREIKPQEVMELFRETYLNVKRPYRLASYNLTQDADIGGEAAVTFEGVIETPSGETKITGRGNGPIDAFFIAIKSLGVSDYKFVTYSEHAIDEGSASKAVAYIQLKKPDGGDIFGVGISSNINIAPIRAILNAINRAQG